MNLAMTAPLSTETATSKRPWAARLLLLLTDGVTGLAVAAIVAVVLVQVGGRLLGSPLSWTEELTRALFIFIAATGKLAAWVFAYDGLPVMVGTWLGSVTQNTTLIMVLIFLFLVVVGMFMDAIAAMFILIPILVPPAVMLGVDPIHLLVVTVISLTLGLVTPPVGVCLIAVAKVTNMRLEEVIRSSTGPVSVLVVSIVCLVLFPVLVVGPLKLFGLY